MTVDLLHSARHYSDPMSSRTLRTDFVLECEDNLQLNHLRQKLKLALLLELQILKFFIHFVLQVGGLDNLANTTLMQQDNLDQVGNTLNTEHI